MDQKEEGQAESASEPPPAPGSDPRSTRQRAYERHSPLSCVRPPGLRGRGAGAWDTPGQLFSHSFGPQTWEGGLSSSAHFTGRSKEAQGKALGRGSQCSGEELGFAQRPGRPGAGAPCTTLRTSRLGSRRPPPAPPPLPPLFHRRESRESKGRKSGLGGGERGMGREAGSVCRQIQGSFWFPQKFLSLKKKRGHLLSPKGQGSGGAGGGWREREAHSEPTSKLKIQA